MKLRILYRVIQEVPVDKRGLQKEFEHRSDLLSLKMGIPLPVRMRPFTGPQTNLIRVHEREFESVADFCKLMQKWFDSPECQALDEAWEKCYNWEKREILYADDPRDPVTPWLQMAAEKEPVIRYVVNPDYKMPKDQPNYRG